MALAQALRVQLPGWAQMPQVLMAQPIGLGLPLVLQPLVVVQVLGVRLPGRVQLTQVARLLVLAQGPEAQLVETPPLVAQ